MADIQELIKKLNSFQTRKSAKTQLIQAGEECVEDLSKALTGPMRDNVKWNVIDILAQIGSDKALSALRTCAEDPTFESVCHEAIITITGEEPESEPDGTGDLASRQEDRDELRRKGAKGEESESDGTGVPAEEETEEDTPAAEEPSPTTPATAGIPRKVPPPPSKPVKPNENITRVAEKIITKVVEKKIEVPRKPLTPSEARSLVESVVEELDCDDVKPVKEGSRQTGLTFTTKTDKQRRRQNVNIVWDTTDEDGTETMVLYSICCEAKEDYFETALRWNQNIASGSICITDIKGKPNFILLQHISLDLATRETVQTAIKSLAGRADQIEKVLTGAEDIR